MLRKVISQYISYRRSFTGDFPIDLALRNNFVYLDPSSTKINPSSWGSQTEGSGLDIIMALCGFSIVGTDSLVAVNHIIRTRCFIQVAACVMFSRLKSPLTKNLCCIG